MERPKGGLAERHSVCASNGVTKKLRRRQQQDCGEAQSEALRDHKSEQEPRASGAARRRRLNEPVHAVDRAQANRSKESERFAPQKLQGIHTGKQKPRPPGSALERE